MLRREFIAGLGSAVARPVVARAERPSKGEEHENRKYAFDRSLGGALGRHLDIALLGRREG
jgi:hypothetical protein